MAGFFSLGYQNPNNPNQNPLSIPNSNSNPDSSTWLLYGTTRNTHGHHHHHPTTAKDLDTHADALAMGGGSDGRLINFADESTWGSTAFVMMGGGGGSGGGGGVSCQDCGNQAKKDCPHMRCRTCCKSRGFQCQTHVKSTWVPAAKRRERQQYLSSAVNDQRLHPSNPKRGRSASNNEENDNNTNNNNPISSAPATALAYNSGLDVGNLPTEVTTSANFRCVRVSSIDDTDDQFAYQASVNIGGHLFKGILYDQGVEAQYMGGDTSSGGSAGVPQLNLAATSPGNSPAAANYGVHSLYPSLGTGNDYMTNTQFFYQIPRN